MTKQRDLLKGRVKRLLRDQKDMGQVGDPVAQCCASAVELFVHDLAAKMLAVAKQSGHEVLTPMELKQSVLQDSNGFAFLQSKVQAIQESDAKYRKTATRKRRAATDKTPAAKPAAKKRQSKKTEASAAEAKQPQPATAVAPSSDSKPKAPVIQEDDDYDESDSE